MVYSMQPKLKTKRKTRGNKNKMEDVFKRVSIAHLPNGDIDKDTCWPWKGAAFTGAGGEQRGLFNYLGGVQYAHRIAYQAYYGLSIEAGRVIRHKCDNSLCCNPFHLEIGTQRDNINDRVVRERFGLKHSHLRYVMKMLEIGASASIVKERMKIDHDYDIDESVIRRIKRRELYKQIEWEWGDNWAANNKRSKYAAINQKEQGT